jgi:spermidine synthase
VSEAGLPYRGNLVAVILLTAGCSLVYELAIGTLSTYLMGDSALQFSLTIGVFLAAMGAGAWFAREPGPDPLARLVRIEIAVAVLGGLSGFLLHGAHAVLLDGYTPAMIAVLAVLGTLVGMELPLLAELLRRAGGVRGVFASALAVDYLGALLGSLAFPLALLPMLGTVKAALAAGAVNLVAVTLLLPGLAGAARRRAQLAVAVAGVLIVLAGAWAGQVVSHFEHRLYRDEVLHAETSRFQRIVVTRWRDDLRLYADRELQFSSRDEHRYHEALVHPALAAVSRPERVLVIGGGDGLAVREVLKHPQVVEVVLVDIDPAMTALGRDFPPLVELNRGALADPRVRIDHRDGFAYLREADAGYDVIILDLPDPRTEDLGRLYTLEFYRLAVRALGADGVLATQATSPYYARETFWTIEATLAAAGLATVPYRVHVPAFAEWGFVLGARRPMDPATLRLDLPARWLDVGQFRAALAFDRDTARLPDLPASTLEAPWAWRHYRERTRYWRAGP